MTTLPFPSSMKQVALADLDEELATTRRVLDRLPEEQYAWKPHEKSMSLGGLAAHVANLLDWQAAILLDDEFDLASAPPPPSEGPASRAGLLRSFDEKVASLEDALGRTEDAALDRPWTLRRGERVIFRQPKGVVLRRMGISHMIHHRAQLCVYLRLLNVPVPAVYGPSVDEPGF